MSVTRRQFFKLVAAGAAVAFVPIKAAETFVAALAPAQAAKIPWYVTESSWHMHAGDLLTAMLELRRGDYRVSLDMMVDAMSARINPGDFVELDIVERGRRGRMLGWSVIADGVEVHGVRAVSIMYEPALIETINFYDGTRFFRQTVRGPGIDDLTITKQLREDKP